MEANAGLQPSQTISPSGTDQIAKHKQLEAQQTEADRGHAVEVANLAQQGNQFDKTQQTQVQLAKQKGANEKTSNS